jgi:hypothetical protein
MEIQVTGADFSALGLGSVNAGVNYAAAAGITDAGKKAKLSAFYNALVAAGIWTKFDVIRLLNNGPYGTTKASSLNFRDPSQYESSISAAVPAAFTANGFDFNQGSAYISNYNMTGPADYANFHAHAYNFSAETGTNASTAFMGVYTSAIYLALGRKTTTKGIALDTVTATGFDTTKTGLLSMSKSNGVLNLYDAGVQIATAASAATTVTAALPIYEGAIGSNAVWKSLATISILAYGKFAWTAADELAFKNAVTAYMA